MKVWTRNRAVMAAIVAGAVGIGGFFAASTAARADVATAATEDVPPFAVEDFNYPGAAEIEAQTGIVLKRGDGHIVLAECSEANVLRVEAFDLPGGAACFRVTGGSGYLTLSLPRAFLVHTNDYPTTQLEMTTDGDTASYEFGPEEWQAIGSSADPEGREFSLVEIRVSR